MTDTTSPPKGIHAAVMHAQRLAAEKGIAKDSKANMGSGTVAFRGVEASMNTMAEILVLAGITIEPETLKLDIQHIARAEAGKFVRLATVECLFTFRAEDGSSQVARTFGEAMDFGDKATTKAQSVALRIALFNKFMIPTAATAFDPELTPGNDDGTDGATGGAIDGDPADVPTRQDATPKTNPRGDPPDYPKATFEANFAAWGAAVAAGSATPEAIIAKVSTVGRLNPTQRAKINSLKKAA